MKEVEAFIEKFEPKGLKKRTLLCSFYIATLENLKGTITENMQSYYGEEHIVNGKKSFKNYNKFLPNVNPKKKEHFDNFAHYIYASKELGIINDENIELLRKCFEIRNDAAHGNTISYLLEYEKNEILEESLVVLYNISYAWKCTWYWNIENEKLELPRAYSEDYIPDSHIVFNLIYRVIVEGEELDTVEDAFKPDNLIKRTLICCYYITVLENMRYNVSENIKGFFGDSKFENGELFFENYEAEIEKYGKGSKKHLGKDFAPFLYASAKIGIMSKEQIERLVSCCTLRNDIVHDMIPYILSEENSNIVAGYLNVLYELYYAWDEKWFWDVENSISSEPVVEYVEGVIPGNHLVLRAIYKTLFVDENFYEELKKEYTKIYSKYNE